MPFLSVLVRKSFHMVHLEFDLVNYDIATQHIKHSATVTLAPHIVYVTYLHGQ